MRYSPLLLLLLAGCHSGPPTVFIREVPVAVSAPNTLDVIRFPSSYQAFTVGRRPDAANPALMHEAHVLYLRESPDRWNLQPAPAPSVPPAQPAGSADTAFTPLPMSEQLRQEVHKQQQLSQSLTEQQQRFQQSADALVPAVRKTVELGTQIQQRQQSLEDRLRRLEEVQNPPSFTNWPSVTSTNR